MRKMQEKETINSELLSAIEQLVEKGEPLKNIICDLVEFGEYDFEDIIEVLPSDLLYKLKVELAQEGYREAIKCVPEIHSLSVTGMMTHG